MAIQAGRLRHRVQIQKKGTTLGTRGERTDGWVPDGKKVWAEVVTLSGSEVEQARQMYAKANIQVRMRYRAGLTTENRLKFGTRILHIGHIDRFDQRGIELVLLCGEDA